MRSWLGLVLMLTVVALSAAGISEAQEGLTKQDRQGPVTVTVTLTAPPAIGSPVKARVVLDTHSVALDAIKFEDAVALRTGDDTEIAPAVEQAKGGGHHREAVLVFPPLAQAAALRIVVKGVGGVPERNFSWELPSAR